MNKKYIIGALILIVVGTAFFSYQKKTNSNTSTPDKLILQVPFSPQAPTDKWDRNEDCEETSITMANAFLSGNTSNELAADEALKAINNLKIWEDANLGYNDDTGSMATTRLAEGAFNLKIDHIKDFTEQDIKNALVDNKPVLLPIDARVLDNPLYKNSGPQYHMIVIRGYKDGKFIVNDPGTNRGNGNEYTFEMLKNAAADWNNTTKQLEPQNKIALVLSK